MHNKWFLPPGCPHQNKAKDRICRVVGGMSGRVEGSRCSCSAAGESLVQRQSCWRNDTRVSSLILYRWEACLPPDLLLVNRLVYSWCEDDQTGCLDWVHTCDEWREQIHAVRSLLLMEVYLMTTCSQMRSCFKVTTFFTLKRCFNAEF